MVCIVTEKANSNNFMLFFNKKLHMKPNLINLRVIDFNVTIFFSI